MRTYGCFGGGVDSTCLIAIDTNRAATAAWLGWSEARLLAAFPSPDAWLFSDTGAEFGVTYDNVAKVGEILGPRLIQVRRAGEAILDWCLRLGIVPLMPGASHICSLKFKGEVMQKWAKDRHGDVPVHWLIGIEANEEKRAKRFQKPRTGDHEYSYPLIELGLTRERCLELLAHLGWDTPHKSSCVFCPFMSEPEILEMVNHQPEAWETCKQVEKAFQIMSGVKHQAWLDAGQPLNKGGRAPKGMWRKHSWNEGARLFARKVRGRQLSCVEWEAHLAQSIPLNEVK